MRKNLKFIIPIIICALVVGITFYMMFDIKDKVEENLYGTDDIEVENEVDEELENTVQEENVVEENNTVQDDTSTNTVDETNSTTKEEVSEEDDKYSNKKLDEAKYLVKKAWGEDNSVYFTNEGINSEGLYMVAARDKTSTAVKNYFKVNLETKKVQIDY